jgi:putative membrane protein
MVLTWIFGLWMVFAGLVDWSAIWPWVKAAMVILLSAIHGFYGRLLRDFRNDRNARPSGFFRAINEIPTFLMVLIVILVIVKPF